MINPVDTYRLQFHKGFTFDHLEKIIPYLENLGVRTIYASPIFSAAPGSMHGYDGIDPLQINPEIGSLEQLRKISKTLKKKGIGWLQDIVPNHMAYHPGNLWLMDVLEKGPLSVYRNFFDTGLVDVLFKGPVMTPFLGSELKNVINNGELTIAWNGAQLQFKYAENIWPLNLPSYTTVIGFNKNEPPAAVKQLLEQAVQIKRIEEPAAFALAINEFKLQLSSLLKNSAIKKYFDQTLTAVNENEQVLRQLAESQYYRLCSYTETDDLINYRRFFTVNSLICLNMQNQDVFKKFHQLIRLLVKENVFQGLRIDHIDGLYDPAAYLDQLRRLVGDETYIIVEKILAKDEEMPRWPVQGSTGYDFLAAVNNLFTNRKSEKLFDSFYNKLTPDTLPVPRLIYEKKKYILDNHMAGELDNLARLFLESGFVNESVLKNVPVEEIKQAIGEFLVSLPVYRYYGNKFPLGEEEKGRLKDLFDRIKKNKKELAVAADLLFEVLTGLSLKKNKAHYQKALSFYQRCMQFTGPLMAKGVEDTLMYAYNRLISHNEVGDAPGAFGIRVGNFHDQMAIRQKQWPLAMNTTATHDTKRGEDFRARLNVLTDIADEWLQAVSEWLQENKAIKQTNAPDANDEYFIYQTLVGAYPVPGEAGDDFGSRIEAYLEKTMREAKLHSDWAEPNEKYENDVKQFIKALLDKKNPFWKSFRRVHQNVAELGIINSLSQVLLKLTCPGVPDTYQGCELWDFSFVDPDNRRPVDYELRNELLNNSSKISGFDTKLWDNRFNGQIKLRFTNILLTERKKHPLLFKEGDYIPLKIEGKYKENTLAFARSYQRTWFVVVVPLNIAGMCMEQDKTITELDWYDTRIILPADAPKKFQNLISGSKGEHKQQIALKLLFTDIPFALLKMEQPDSGRSSGILMHITSLPSSFGIGDFGPGARRFADMLHRTHQKYWQILPLGPVAAQNYYSPYSSVSSMAGNTLFISPQLLVDDGLLTENDLAECKMTSTDKVDYREATLVKELFFEKAWQNYKSGQADFLGTDFTEFCAKEKKWLDDYALYAVLRVKLGNKPWYLWPDGYKLSNKNTLKEFLGKNSETIEKEKWLQFLFSRQWSALKSYCNNLGIKFFGDLPFYVSYDAADVWANPKLFSLDGNLNIKSAAGVPPDYFNANGQLWGMPVFCWDKLKANNYKWWVQRIRKNMELFDLLRLDHFRAFSSYWAVPGNEKTAIHGTWEAGPGSDLFKVLTKELGHLPFVAEDLGDIDDEVYRLRDEFGLPGMVVLQFAFGDQMAYSPHIPHNYREKSIAYTGTHDNNTARGWYRQDIDVDARKLLEKYGGVKVKEKDISDLLINIVMASIAKTAIIPLQDLLGLDENARMNVPAVTEGSWLWRLNTNGLKADLEKKLRNWTESYNRIG